MLKRATLVTILAVSTAAIADGKKPPAKTSPGKSAPGPKLEVDDLPGPQPEVARDTMTADLPAVPAFELPPGEAGFHTPRELRVHGQPVLGTEIEVKGYITSIYDCASVLAVSNPDRNQAQIAAAIQKDPTLCERPNFFLGDARDTSREASIWVVDVPRPPTRAEVGARKRSELKGAWPDVPKLTLGEYVTVAGTWALYSPHAQHSLSGLLVYKALDHGAPGAAPAAAVASPAGEPEIDVVSKAPRRAPVSDEVRNASVDQVNACNKALAARQIDAAIAACQAAVKAWPGNHIAWYVWASAHMTRSEWDKAREAVEHAVKLRPDLAMYQLYYGISLYEAEYERVRGEQARRDNKKPEEITVEPGLLQLDAARDALRRAVKLGPDLWRAHYYLGRVYRDLGDSRREAEQFSATIKTHPSYRFGYIAVVELYRRWSYIDQAVAVAQLGTRNVAAAESPELWYELGMAYDARREDDKAIEAFGKAIAGKPDDLGSKFQRGQIHFRKGDFANAKLDLDAVAKSADPSVAGLKPLASQMLGQIAKKH